MLPARIPFDTCRFALVAVALAIGCGPADVTTPADPASANERDPAEASPTDDEATTQPPTSNRHVLHTEPNASAVVIDQGYQLVHGTAEAPLAADAEGRLELPESPAEAIVLLWAPGRAAARFELPTDPAEHHVPLPDATPLRGRLEGADGRVTEVWLQSDGPEAPWPYFVRAAVDERGRFAVDGLAAGTYRVSSVPVGGAPVLAADERGRVRFLAADPGPRETPDHRLVDRAIAADGSEHTLRVAHGEANVVGRVLDESGAPVAGAQIRFTTESGREQTTTTDARGGFSAGVRPAPYVYIRASHPDFGEQWTDYQWSGWSRHDAIPEAPIELVLRRGVVLRGRIRNADGSPFASQPIVLVPAYVGSGPPSVTTRTDAEGRFAFDRMVLDSFELVPRSLSHWNVSRPGDWLRIRSDTDAWIEAARAGDDVELTIEQYTLVPVRVDVSRLRSGHAQIWIRRTADDFHGSAPRIPHSNTLAVVAERGVPHEIWVEPYDEGPLTAPWTRDVAPTWSGTPEGPFRIRVE